MAMDEAVARLERERDAREAFLTTWSGLAVTAERTGDIVLQEITTRGTDLALFRLFLGEAAASPYTENPQAFVRTLFHLADKAELECERDAGLAQRSRDCLFKLLSGLGNKDADKIIEALADILAAIDTLDVELGRLHDEYEAHTKGA
ncbi:hypothetical protein [Paenibacillus tengchongensis]|uniref:hypothetical protein n=1 Tax=Paenibacillus tengchongensis TaxID=2608684 RepID=UPI00124C49CD|nr:hypothetical protein [Paenibacillus tengchongensis]